MTRTLPPDGVPGMAAHRVAASLRRGELSVAELVTELLDRTDRLEPDHHALVSRRPRDEVLAQAAAAQGELAAGRDRGWLHGLPLAVKDLADVAGLPTTLGFWTETEAPRPAEHGDLAARLAEAGALFVGKTSTPELGLGSHTYTAVGPTTGNAFDPTWSAGGSSGGAAVAVATGMVPVADGSDFMGSLRNPPGWNGVFGLRPTAPMDPRPARTDVTGDGGVDGPIARDAADLALMLSTLQGRTVSARRPDATLTVGWLGDLDGYLATDDGVLEACAAGLQVLADGGHELRPASLPSAAGLESIERLWPAWLTFRHSAVGAELASFADDLGVLERLKPEARWEIDGWRALTSQQVEAMAATRVGLARAFEQLFETFDLLLLPTAQVFPFAKETHWPQHVGGREMDTYHRWMEVTAPATLAGLPVLAAPLPDTARPLGIQVIGPRDAEPLLLGVAGAWQAAVSGDPGVALARPTESP